MNHSSNTYATLIGYIALLIWSSYALVIVGLNQIPLFELLSLMFIISFMCTSIKLTIKRQWSLIKQPAIIWVIGVGGIYGNDLVTIGALKNAPPIQVDLINYLWPILVVVFSGFLPNEKFSLRAVLSAFIGLMGIYILLTNGHGLNAFHFEYIKGYLLALAASIIWASYTLLSRFYHNTPREMIGMYFGIGAIISVGLHCFHESTVVPNMKQWILIAVMSFLVSGISYFMWDYGVKKGNIKLLGILTYGNPIISSVLLVIFGYAKYNTAIAVATFCVIAGALFGNEKLIKKYNVIGVKE